jgi:hypothetical protein
MTNEAVAQTEESAPLAAQPSQRGGAGSSPAGFADLFTRKEAN